LIFLSFFCLLLYSAVCTMGWCYRLTSSKAKLGRNVPSSNKLYFGAYSPHFSFHMMPLNAKWYRKARIHKYVLWFDFSHLRKLLAAVLLAMNFLSAIFLFPLSWTLTLVLKFDHVTQLVHTLYSCQEFS
jgi:hypothetical protein